MVALDSPETWRWIWLFAALVFTIGEIFVAGTFFFMPFAVGAVAAAIAAFAGASVALEWLAFVGASAVSFAVLVPLGRRLDRRSSGQQGVGAQRWVGRQAYVLQDIPSTGGTGLIRLEREEWRAESLTGAPIRAGSTVLVSRVDGTRLVVLPIDEPLDPVPELGP